MLNMINIYAYLRSMIARRLALTFLTLLILFADSGQMIYAHTCLKSNHTSLSLFTPASDCCGKEETTKRICCAKKAAEQKKNCALGKMDCCSVSAKYIKQSFPSGEMKLSLKEVEKPLAALVTLFAAFINIPSDKISYIVETALPPGKADIRFTQVFRI
jgi:hypothetical protein